jgi:hypothetical protein
MRRGFIAAGLLLLAAFALAPVLRKTSADQNPAASTRAPARAPDRAAPDAADAPPNDPVQPAEASAPEVIPVPNDPRAAQQMVLRRRDIEDCMRARSTWWAERWTVRTGVRWLPPDERERVERAFAQSRARQLDSCRRQGLRLEGDALPELPDSHLDALLQAAAATGDPRARLHQLWRQRGRRDLDSQVRPVLVAALDAALREADPELLADIGYVMEQHRDDDIGELQNGWRPGGRSGEVSFDRRSMWMLAACDLGLDCSATSRTLDRLCVADGLCGYDSVQAALDDGRIPPDQAAETERRRRMLVDRLRRGQVAGMFDPVRTPPGL